MLMLMNEWMNDAYAHAMQVQDAGCYNVEKNFKGRMNRK
jgi:hypothetical protein